MRIQIIRKLSALLLLGSLTFGAGMAHAQCKILVMGDSLSAAYGIAVEQGWVALMESKLSDKFPKCSVINASVSGETTAGGRTRLPALLSTHKPSHMVLELGANDGLRGLSLSAMQDNLRFMTQAAKKQGVKVVLVGMMIPPNYGPSYTLRFAQTFEDVASQEGLPLVPFMLDGFADKPNAFQADGIHPNAASQPAILGNIWPYVEPLLSHP